MRKALLILLCALLLIATQTPAGAAVERNGELVADGAWCWFQDPRAVHYIGEHDRTYIGYVTSTGDIDVISQDNGTAALTHSVLHVGLAADDHAAPGLEVLPDGHIAVFYTGHPGQHMYYRVSTRPEDVSSFGAEHTIPGSNTGPRGFTYANPIYLTAEHRTYLFFRGGDFKPNVTWSDDNLKTWAPIRTLIEPDKPQTSIARPYVQYTSNGVDTITIAFTDGHPRDISTNSVYALTLKHGILRTITGTAEATIGTATATTPAIPVHTANLTPLYDGSGPDGEAWVHDVALDSAGNPIVVFASFPSPTDHRYHYSHWTGTAWTDTEFTPAGGSIDTSGKEPDYSGGIVLDQADPSIVYTSREINGQWEIERWTTPDGGQTFNSPAPITQNSPNKNVRPVVPWGPPGEIEVLWMSGQYDHYSASGYHTQLRELTSGRAPTTTRISTSTTVAKPGQPITVSARVVQGYQGAPLRGAAAQLWGHESGGTYRLLASATADSVGLVHFPVTQSRDMRYEVRFPATTDWGSSISPSAVVHELVPTAARISATPTRVHKGRTVVVGIRVVNAHTGHGIGGVHVQLWQHLRSWAMRGTYTADAHGLVHVTTRPSQSLVYRGKFRGSGVYGASSTGTITVRVIH